jgi:hypothetical protein
VNNIQILPRYVSCFIAAEEVSFTYDGQCERQLILQRDRDDAVRFGSIGTVFNGYNQISYRLPILCWTLPIIGST